MKKCIIAVALLLLGHAANAEVPEWLPTVLEKDNPDELAVFVYSDENCPMTLEETTELVEGVLVRSRVKPVSLGAEKDLFLDVTVYCLKPAKTNPVFVISVNFSSITEDGVPIAYDFDFGTIGMGKKENVEATLRSLVEDAITVYLRANFDLGE
ncbi:MAG: hypothetical protein QNJ19_13355 [Woeseiaceae bacterium]|nr:hypothetical protein [Woeseiaceae bacterium]